MNAAQRTAELEQAADLLCRARLNAAPIASLPDPLQPVDIDESYRLQMLLNRKLAAQFGEPIGFKIGCTTEVMQQYLGISHPCKGVIFRSTLHRNHASFRASDLCRPGVECEIAVQLSNDMTAERDYTADNCDAFVGAVMCAIELVDDRWINYSEVTTPTLLAENFFGAGCVTGTPLDISGAELASLEGRMRVNGDEIGSGSAADILGHPYQALAWLANHQAERGTPLKQGDIISLGSVVQTHWLAPGDEVEIEFSRLGRCSLKLA